jgi:hypothetical protein
MPTLILRLLMISVTLFACAGPAVAATPARPAAVHDFDWEFGTWDTALRRLRAPLSGKSEWVEYSGTTVVTPALDGRANLVELKVNGPAGRIEGLSLRLFQPGPQQWTLNFANIADGAMTRPVTGAFHGTRGEFYGEDSVDGRAVLVRFLIEPVKADGWRFEQAYSADGGKTWEVNWIATDTRRAGKRGGT